MKQLRSGQLKSSRLKAGQLSAGRLKNFLLNRLVGRVSWFAESSSATLLASDDPAGDEPAIPTRAEQHLEWGTHAVPEAAKGPERFSASLIALKLTALLLTAFSLLSCSPPRPNHPVIGAKNFTEQVILGELLAQEIEAKTGLKVERRFYLAGSYIAQQALASGRIDAYVEYTGTALTAILKQPVDKDATAVLATVTRLYRERYKVEVAPALGFENTFAMVMRGAEAKRLNVRTLSEAVADAPQLRLGVGYEFEQRPDGLRGLSAAYGLKFNGDPRTMDLGLLYRALNSNQVDIVAGNSTDGPIKAFGFAVLADDKHYFPPYQAVPLVREESLRRWPEMRAAFDALAGKISAEEMQAMNEAVDGEHRDPAQVVREFRSGKGL